MTIWITIFVVGVTTYLIRLSFIGLAGVKPLPERVKTALRFVPPAVLTAIIFPAAIAPAGKVDISTGNFRLLASLAAVIVAWRTKSVAATIITGVVVLALLTWLLN